MNISQAWAFIAAVFIIILPVINEIAEIRSTVIENAKVGPADVERREQQPKTEVPRNGARAADKPPALPTTISVSELPNAGGTVENTVENIVGSTLVHGESTDTTEADPRESVF